MKWYPKIFIKWSKECESYLYWVSIKNRIVSFGNSNQKTKRLVRKEVKDFIKLNKL